ncbi:cadherin-like protein 26 [Clarias gariepinus]
MRKKIMTLITLFITCVATISAQSKIRQKRTWIVDSFNIEEESPGPFPYSLGKINIERPYLVMFFLKGMGIDEDPKDVLSINIRTGEVLVHKKVDYETYKNLSFRFEALNENFKLDTKLGVEVHILDINDHAPVFNPPHYETTLEESVPQGTLITTVFASDRDDPSTPNGTFSFTLDSVSPKTDNIEFYISQIETKGNIYFKGCLDYQKAQTYTLSIKATDNGDKKQLSNTSRVVLKIIDKNNCLPEITGQTGPGKIKERESGVEVLRLIVRDDDTNGSPAWKAIFTLHEDPENYFKIHTDPKTNEGILTVIKPMDYEEQTTRNLTISVENEEPYFSCKVKSPTTSDLWDVETLPKKFRRSPAPIDPPKLYPVTIIVEDVNDPPEFVPPVKKIQIKENTKVGTILGTLKVKDPDKTFGNSFRFVKGEDKNDWVTVNSETGQVSVAKMMDRESPLVNASTYSVIVYAVSKDKLPQTGTGTLVIHLDDENDNVPQLVVDTVSMCLSDEKAMTEISAKDPDLPPYTAPFQYELLEDDQIEGKWKIEPNHGILVNLVKENTVYAGLYKIRIKISDSDGNSSVQNLSITVCDCTSKPSCQVRGLTAQASLSATGIMIFAFLLLLVIPLMALQLIKKQKKTMIFPKDGPGSLIKSNTEDRGTDCEVSLEISQSVMSGNIVKTSNGFSKQRSILYNGSTKSLYRQIKNGSMMESTRKKHSTCSTEDVHIKNVLKNQLSQRLAQLQTSEQELSNYEPHCYAYEGEQDENLDDNFDTISVPETDFNLDIPTNLELRFTNLAAVCRPDSITSERKK